MKTVSFPPVLIRKYSSIILNEYLGAYQSMLDVIFCIRFVLCRQLLHYTAMCLHQHYVSTFHQNYIAILQTRDFTYEEISTTA